MSRALADCIRLHGKVISRDDAAELGLLAEELGGGRDGSLAATRQLIRRLGNERDGLLDEIEAAGGVRKQWEEHLFMDEISFNTQLNEMAQKLEAEFAEYLTGLSWTEIKLIYSSMNVGSGWSENTWAGKILNTDAMRELSDKYRQNRLLADAMHEPASAAIKKLFRERVQEPALDNEVWLFMAGGPSSGKSSALGLSEWSDPASLIFDGTLSDFQKDDNTKIAAALESGREVAISYVFMDPAMAFHGALMRAQSQKDEHGSGRPILIDEFVNGTVGANVAIRQFYEKYSNDDRTAFSFFVNAPMFDEDGNYSHIETREATINDIPRLSRAEVRARALELINDARATGEIDEEIYDYSINQPLRTTVEAGPTGPAIAQQEDAGARQAPEGTVSPELRATGEAGAALSRAEPEPEITPETRQKHAQMRLALARPIRQLAGTLDVQLLQTRSELPPDVRPGDDAEGVTIEGFWRRGTDEAYLVAENIESLERAQQVLAHEAFGHYAMEQLPEFNEILAGIKNLKSIGNRVVKDTAARVAATQGVLDETTEAKEILATMVERGVRSSTIDRAIAAARRVLRRLGFNLQMDEAEIRTLITEAARGLQTQARAKRAALANMPTEAQILEDPLSVNSAIRNAIEEIYANSVLQDTVLQMHEQISDGTEAASDRLETMRNNPRVAPDVLYQRAFHGTGAPAFDRFDINYIGTGEGAAAHGWGLYFSSARGVAEWYQRKLSGGLKYSYGEKEMAGRSEVIAELGDDLQRHLLSQGLPIEATNLAGPEVAAAAVGMYARHSGSMTAIKEELGHQRDNALKSVRMTKEMNEDYDPDRGDAEFWGALGYEGVLARYEATAEAYDRAIELVNGLEGAKAAGSLMEVEVPEDAYLLHFDKPLAAHSQKVQDALMKKYPDLFREQWVNSYNGRPAADGQLVTQEMIAKFSAKELDSRGYMLAKPADRMSGRSFYEWSRDEFSDAGHPWYHTDTMQKVSEMLRDELGVPGHSFTGVTSDETNYVIYDNAQIDITAINDVQVADRIDSLFSRTVFSETPDRPAEPGKPFLVYRFGSGAEALVNKNAGNAASVARRLSVFDDWEAPQSGNAGADRVSVYRVVADKFTDYVAMNRGEAGGEVGFGVGRYTAGVSRSDPTYQEVSYSFGLEGYTAEKMAEIPLQELRDRMQSEFGYNNFDMSGSGIGAQALQAATPMFSRRVQADPEIEAIRARVMAPALEDIGVKDRIRDVVDKLFGLDWLRVKQGLVDSAASVEAMEKRLFGRVLDASQSAYKAVLATKNIGSVMSAVMHRGIPILREGVFQPRKGRKGFVEIFTPITQHKDGNLLPLWELYAVARRSDRLINERNPDGTIKEKLMTREDINRALELGNQHPEFEVAFREWNKFNSQALDLAIKTGVINKDEAAIWRKNDYVPFYRAMEELEMNQEGQGPRGGGTIEGVRPRIRRLTGSTQKIGNVFENMVMNTAYLIDASFRNDAMQRIVHMADGMAMERIPMAWEAVKITDGDMARALMRAGLIVGNGVTETDMLSDGIRQVKAMTPDQKQQWSTLFRRVAPVGDDIVSVMIGGKPVYYRVDDPLLLRTIGNMGMHQFGGIMSLFRFSKKLLTSAVTIDPAFMMANFVRDTLSSWIVADTGGAVPPVVEALKGAKAAFTEDEDVLAIMMAGAGGGGFYDHNPAEVRKMLAKKLPKGKLDAFQNSIITPRGAWRFWQKIGNAAEQANRVAKFRQIRRNGGTVAEAAYEARDILNFSMSGDFVAMKVLVQSVPFLNARVQGLYRLWRGGKENPVGFAMKGLSIVGASMALLLKNMDDDRYEELPEWDKDTYWHFFIEGEHFRLPKPFEVGAMFGTMPERFVRAAAGRDDWDLFGKRFYKMVAETLQFNPTPQLLKPIVEQYANRNMFTGAPIVGFTLSNLKPEAQYDHWTSDTMKVWSEAMPDIAPDWLRSPKRLEAAVRGYTGAVGMYVLGASDSMVRRATGQPSRPSKALQDYPVITRFWRNPQPRTSKYTNQLYEMLNEADSLFRTMNAYKAQNRIEEVQDLLEGNQGKLAARKYLHSVSARVREINNQMKLLAFSDASAEEKRKQMEVLNQAKLETVRQVAHVAELF